MRASKYFLCELFLKERKTKNGDSKSDNSKVGLSTAMKNTDINGLHKISTRNHTVVALNVK